MVRRLRATLLIAAAGALCAASTHAAGPPPLYITYNANGNLTVGLTDGSGLGGSALAPGPYWVTISNESYAEHDTVHKWHFFGAGVDVVTDLNNGDNKVEQYLETLQPGAAYTAQDDYRPALQVVVRTAATGSSTSGSSGGSPGSGGNLGSVSNTGVVGSEAFPFRGTLAAAVSKTGKLSLTRNGVRVTSLKLKTGRYAFAILDHSETVGFTLRRLKHAPLTISSAAFTGRKTVELNLPVGRWFFFFDDGAATQFFVVSY
jgi:hypothetical protein